ncbi:MAG: hypothetical protein KDE51_08215 [Anaerolineales bacterium]|nr:hypothetical protein [Anaerolineales bacterium]
MDELREELEKIQKQLAELQAKQTDELDKERQQRISELNQRREILEIKVESGAVSMGDGSSAYGAGATHIEGGVHYHHHYPPQPQGFSFDWQQSPAHSFLLTTFLIPRLASEHPTDTKWAYVLGESPEKAVDRFLARRLLERCAEAERVDFQLARLDEERLTELLAKYNLPSADDKVGKIKRLLTVDSWALLAEIGPVELLRCTPLGREKAQAYLQNGGRILETVQDEPTRQMVPELLKWLAVAGVGAVIGSQLDDLFAQLLPKGVEFAPAPENPAASERRRYRMNTRQRQLLERMTDKRYSFMVAT